MLSLSVHKNLDYSTPIFFVPLGVATTPIKSTPTKITPKKVTADKPKPVAPAPAKTEVKKPTTVATPSSFAPLTPRLQSAGKATADTSVKTDVKKPEPAQLEPPKQEITQKTEPVKPELPKREVKKAEPKIEEKKEIVKPADIKPTPIAQALDTNQTIVPIVPENAQISHNYREVEALRKQAQLQKEIVQTWKPPIGVSPDCVCEISFFVTQRGKIETIKIIKSSGVMMFDISVRQALFAIKMPQWTYGKPFTIDFKQ